MHQSSIFCLESIVFLAEETDQDGEEGDEHLAGRRIPTEMLDTEFEAEIVDGKVDCNYKNITN